MPMVYLLASGARGGRGFGVGGVYHHHPDAVVERAVHLDVVESTCGLCSQANSSVWGQLPFFR